MSRMYLSSTPIDAAVLTDEGSDLRTALAGRVPDENPDLNRFLSRRGRGIEHWRVIFDGSLPDYPGSYVVNLAAPVEGGWMVASFQRQRNGGWALVYTDPIQPHIE